MKVLKTEKKGKHLNTLEKYHIYKTSKEGLQMNDAYIDTHNPIREVIQEINDRERQKTHYKRKEQSNSVTHSRKGTQLSQLKKEDTVTTESRPRHSPSG
jgi:hypothetical protein